MKKFKMILAIVSVLIASTAAGAMPVQQQPRGKQPIYTITINVVERKTKAINYSHRNGATKIDFRGTVLMPESRGEAKVESKQGYIEIEVEFRNMQAATRFGPELLTYVLWTITPEGRASNAGEIILNGTSSKLDVTTELQSFGMIVTAEPYFGVTQPSDVVVMENFVRTDTVGKVEEIDAKYELLQRGQYTVNVLPADLKPLLLDKKTPLDLYQARNAVRIAKWAGADVSAADSFDKANKLLMQAEAYKTRKAGSKPIAMTSREAVQTAEDARLITLKAQAEARLEKERSDAAGREANAKAEAAAALALTERTRMEADAAAQRAAAEAKAVAERTRMEADAAAQRAARDKEAAAAALKSAAEKAEREKQELRSKMMAQLNLILQTRDSARGLIVNMSDVLFDTGQFTLKPGAREKLARIAGIVAVYPTLKLEVEGHTDSVGGEESNMRLSENRANAVKDYLIQQGIVYTSIASRGFGKGQPVASNDNATGRQQNRRVELVVSGDAIGGESKPQN